MIAVTFVTVGGRADQRRWKAETTALNKQMLLLIFAAENHLRATSLYLATCGSKGAIFQGEKLVGTFTYCDETDQMALQE